MRTPILGAAAATLLAGACLGAVLYRAHAVRLLIVIKPEAVVRQGPLDASATKFSLHDGAELRLLDQKGDWFAVSAGPLRQGWIRNDQVIPAP